MPRRITINYSEWTPALRLQELVFIRPASRQSELMSMQSITKSNVPIPSGTQLFLGFASGVELLKG